MRRVVVLSVLVLALAVPAAASSLAGDDDGTLSVRNGVGRVTLTFSGSAVGRVAHGVIYANDPIANDGDGVDFYGCGRTIIRATGSYCTGDNIRFRATGGRYFVSVKGSGIFLSAVGRGVATFDGRGDEPAVPRDGVYSINDGPYKSLPDDEKRVPLVPPVGG